MTEAGKSSQSGEKAARKEEWKVRVSEAARIARERKGVAKRTLAKRSGVHVNIIDQLERGKTDPRLSSVELLADALGLSIDEYIGHRVQKK